MKGRLDYVTVIGHWLEPCANARSKNQSHVSSDICSTARAARNLEAVGQTLLSSVTQYLYEEGQKVRTSEERDAFTLALAICGACRRGETDPVAVATYSAFGSTLDRYLKYRAQKQWIQHQELLRCIPDYDPEATQNELALPNGIALMALRTDEPPLDELAGVSDVAGLSEVSQGPIPVLQLRDRGLNPRYRVEGVLNAKVRRELQPVASQIISWPVPETVGEAGRDKPPSRGAVGSKPATDSRKFAEVGARPARTRKRGLGAG